MAASPIIVLAIVLMGQVFMAALFGEEYASDSFGDLGTLEGECNGDGFFAGIMCAVEKVVQFFQIIGAVISFFFKVAFFIIPGAPWYIQVPISTIVLASILWSVATLFRGN